VRARVRRSDRAVAHIPAQFFDAASTSSSISAEYSQVLQPACVRIRRRLTPFTRNPLPVSLRRVVRSVISMDLAISCTRACLPRREERRQPCRTRQRSCARCKAQQRKHKRTTAACKVEHSAAVRAKSREVRSLHANPTRAAGTHTHTRASSLRRKAHPAHTSTRARSVGSTA
jgi:hypothetical protein